MIYNLDLEACTNKVFWDVLKDPKPFNLLQSGTRTGKTFAMAQMIYLHVLKYQHEPTDIHVVSESMPHMKKGIKHDFFNFLNQHNLEPQWNEDRNDSMYRKGKVKLDFFSVDAPSKQHGSGCDFLFGNEIQNLKYETMFHKYQRTNKRCYFDFNPTHNFWVFKELIENPEFKNDIKVVKSSVFDNKFLSPNVLKTILARAKIDKNYKRVYLDGEIGSVEGLIFPNFKQVNEIPIGAQFLGYGVDFGFNDPMTIIACYKNDNELFFKEIYYETGKEITHLINFIRSNKLTGYFFCDSARKDLIQTMKNNGINAIGARKYAGSVLDGINLLKGYDLTVTNNSLNLIKEFRNYSYIRTKDNEFLEQAVDDFNHGIDALRYCISETLFKHNIKPQKIIK